MLAQGVYNLRATEFEIGKIAFSYGPPDAGTQLLMRRPPGAVQAKLTMPPHSKLHASHGLDQADDADALDGDTEVVVRIKSNSCHLKNARLQLESLEDAMQYDLSAARDEGHCVYTSSKGDKLTSSHKSTGQCRSSGGPRSWHSPRSSDPILGHSTWRQRICESLNC